MGTPRWIKSMWTTLSATDRRLCLSKVVLGTAVASLSTHPVSAQQRAHKSDIKSPIDSGFTKNNEKFILTAADSFVVSTRGDTLRFSRSPIATPAAPSSGHSSHASHASHSSHSSHASHRSGGGWS